MAEGFSFWLLPAEPLKERLRAIVSQLALACDAVEFEPHVTVFSSQSTEDAACAAANRIAHDYSRIDLLFRRLDGSDELSKTLFIQFAQSSILRYMSQSIGKILAESGRYRLDPHLSLVYQNLSDGRRRDIQRRLQTPTGLYVFDALAVVGVDMPFQNPTQVGQWRKIVQLKFEAPCNGRGDGQ